MAVTDIATLKVIATPPSAPAADGAGFDSGLGLAFSSNGGDGTLSVVKLVNGKYETVDNVHDRARRPHHDGGSQKSPRVSAGRGVRPCSGIAKRPEESARACSAGQFSRSGRRQVMQTAMLTSERYSDGATWNARRTPRSVLSSAILILLVLIPAFAQERQIAISGTVLDPTGTPVSGTEVTLRPFRRPGADRHHQPSRRIPV